MGGTVGRVIPAAFDGDHVSEAQLAISLYWTCRTGNHHVAGNLIARGADLNVRHPDSGEGSLHAATGRGHVKVVQELLVHGADPNLRSTAPREETPLHCAVRTAHNPRAQWTRSRALQCAKILLLDQRIKVDIRDHRGFTPVHLAAENELWDIVEYLIAAGANIDLSVNGKTARDIIESREPKILSLAPQKIESQISKKSKMYDDLRNGKQEKFIARLSTDCVIDDETLQRFLQHASVNGYTKVVKHLLEMGADPNSTVDDSQTPPVILAAKHGYHETLKVLLDALGPSLAVLDHPLWRRTALHHAAISAADAPAETEVGARSLVKCVTLILERARARHLNIDAMDFRGNTALHYAAKSNRRDIVKLLLRQEASIFLQNEQKVPVFLHINRKDLFEYFDNRITVKGSTKSEKYHSMVLNYNFLEPPPSPVETEKTNNVTAATNTEEEEARRFRQARGLEMEPLLLLSRSAVHCPLLKHPIVTSFLHLKWQRVKLYFSINFFLYLMFTATLTLHIHFLVTSSSQNKHMTSVNDDNSTSSPYEYDAQTPHNFIRWLAAFFMLWPLCRELLEMLMSLRRYVRNIENLMETTLVGLSIVLIFIETSHHSRQIMSAIAILLTYTDLVFLIGRHPKFATYITMFKRVSSNFLKFFFLFSFLIFAFAFSFFIIFHDCFDKETCETRFFVNLGSSIFKTIIMLTGELEAETIQFDLFGYFMFTGFVVFIAICLLNLLTGLAVSDITAIREEAEVDSCRAKVKLYGKIESILLGHSIEGLSAENWFVRRMRVVASRMFGAKVRLLGNLLPENRLEVYLNVDNKMEPDVHARSWRARMLPCAKGPLSGRNQEWDAIVAEAQVIVGSRCSGGGGGGGAEAETKKIMARLDILESKLTTLIEALQPNTDLFSMPSTPSEVNVAAPEF